eukprot:m.333334 g.333334  ORF g.333334 m.333334 type:complete len:85 (-) comp17123_c0_seq1:83-337(-)
MDTSEDKKEQPKKKEEASSDNQNGEELLIADDDEFEEFPREEWGEAELDKEDVAQWEDNWDDDNMEDDFSKQLRAELQKAGHLG